MDSYITESSLGKGNFGSLYVVRCSDDQQQYVMKRVNLSRLDEPGRIAALNEAQLLSSLAHPCIVGYRESFMFENELIIIMEYCHGGDLADRITTQRAHGPFPEAMIMEWFVQIALALQYIHSRRILHRDLKAGNLFLTSEGRIKLGDFGISRVLNNEEELARTVIGTPYYLSPEICEGKSYANKSDVWSLGCVIYELCTLKHAFNGRTLPALVLKILNGVYPPISASYSPLLRHLIDAMLQQQPAQRPNIGQILRVDIMWSYEEKLISRWPELANVVNVETSRVGGYIDGDEELEYEQAWTEAEEDSQCLETGTFHAICADADGGYQGDRNIDWMKQAEQQLQSLYSEMKQKPAQTHPVSNINSSPTQKSSKTAFPSVSPSHLPSEPKVSSRLAALPRGNKGSNVTSRLSFPLHSNTPSFESPRSPAPQRTKQQQSRSRLSLPANLSKPSSESPKAPKPIQRRRASITIGDNLLPSPKAPNSRATKLRLSGAKKSNPEPKKTKNKSSRESLSARSARSFASPPVTERKMPVNQPSLQTIDQVLNSIDEQRSRAKAYKQARAAERAKKEQEEKDRMITHQRKLKQTKARIKVDREQIQKISEDGDEDGESEPLNRYEPATVTSPSENTVISKPSSRNGSNSAHRQTPEKSTQTKSSSNTRRIKSQSVIPEEVAGPSMEIQKKSKEEGNNLIEDKHRAAALLKEKRRQEVKDFVRQWRSKNKSQGVQFELVLPATAGTDSNPASLDSTIQIHQSKDSSTNSEQVDVNLANPSTPPPEQATNNSSNEFIVHESSPVKPESSKSTNIVPNLVNLPKHNSHSNENGSTSVRPMTSSTTRRIEREKRLGQLIEQTRSLCRSMLGEDVFSKLYSYARELGSIASTNESEEDEEKRAAEMEESVKKWLRDDQLPALRHIQKLIYCEELFAS